METLNLGMENLKHFSYDLKLNLFLLETLILASFVFRNHVYATHVSPEFSADYFNIVVERV